MSRLYPCIYYTEDGHCEKYSDDEVTSWCVQGPCEYETPSNGDRIRMMTDEELADFISARHYTPHCPVPQCEADESTDCDQCWLHWLRKEANEKEM